MTPSELKTWHLAREEAPDLLERWLGVPVLVNEASSSADFIIRAGTLDFAVILKGRADVATVGQALEQIQSSSALFEAKRVTPLVLVPYMTPTGRARLAAAGISWLDLSGNACIQEPGHGVHVWVEGKTNRFTRRGRPTNTFAPKASRLVRHLLLHPGQTFSQRNLATVTGLGEGYVSRLTRRLEDLGLLVRTAEGAVVPRDYDLLLEAWVEANAYRHKIITGHFSGRSGEDCARRLVSVLAGAGIRYALTGLAAAWTYTHAAAFRSVACYLVDKRPLSALQAEGFRTDTKAPNVRLLIPDDEGVFEGEREVDALLCVSPVQVYVDLQQEPERAAEFAEALRSRYLTWPEVAR